MIDLRNVAADASGLEVEVRVDRQQMVYVLGRARAPDGREVRIRFEAPVIHTVQELEVAPG